MVWFLHGFVDYKIAVAAIIQLISECPQLLYVNVNVMYHCAHIKHKPAINRTRMNRVTNTYSISELASEFGITTRTIRFYEEKGYLSPKRDGTRRIYSAPDRTSLRLILRGKRLGLSLDETADLIKMYGSPRNNRKQLEMFVSWIGEKRADLERKRKDLEFMLNDLQSVEDKCQLALAEHGNQI